MVHRNTKELMGFRTDFLVEAMEPAKELLESLQGCWQNVGSSQFGWFGDGKRVAKEGRIR